MPDSLPRMPSKGPLTTERRQHPRHPVRPTEYIEIGDSNGGIILDISESGMAVASAQALVGNQTLRFRFQLPRSVETIETSGEINWIGETKKRAGIRFIDLPLAAREQIHKWIDSQISGHANGEDKPNRSAVTSPSSKLSQELAHYTPVRHELEPVEPAAPLRHSSKNLNPFSSALSSPLDEPEIEEAEPEEEEKTTADSAKPLPERRSQVRLPLTASTYVQLSDGNGGLMGNLSKGGFNVRAAKTLETDQLPVVRFQLPNSRIYVEASAWIVWKSPSKKAVGARFEDLSAEAQSQIAQWIDSQPLSKIAAIKNPLAKNPLSSTPAVDKPLEQREKISSSSKIDTPAAAPAVKESPVKLMAPDSVPLPAYISPLAASLDSPPAPSSAIRSSSPQATAVSAAPPPLAPSAAQPPAPPLAKVPPIASPAKPSAASTEKTLAPVPTTAPASLPLPRPATVAASAVTSPAVTSSSLTSATLPPSTVTSSPVSPQTKKHVAKQSSIPAASSSTAPPLTPSSTPRVVPPLLPSSPAKSLSAGPSLDISRDAKKTNSISAAATASATYAPATSAGSPVFEPDWSIAPKRPTGYWKIAAMIVVILGALFGATTLLRSKKPAAPASQETAQNSSMATSALAVASSSDSSTNPAPTNQPASSTPTPSSTSAASNTTPNSSSPREFSDAPRNPAASKTAPKNDDQFVDEPRPSQARSVSNQPVPDSTLSQRSASSQPSSSTPIQSTPRNQSQPVAQNPDSSIAVSRPQTTPALAPSSTNNESVSTAVPSSPPASASLNQQSDTNAGSSGPVAQNSPATSRPVTPENNSSSRTTTNSAPNSSSAITTTSVPAAATAATIPNPVPTVSVFSRFRSIRSSSEADRPAGSDLQIGRLVSGPAPSYPIEAQRQQIQGVVELQVLVGADGNILTVHLVKGPPELASVAMGTVRSWQYGKTTLGGRPVETDQSIYFTFKLTK